MQPVRFARYSALELAIPSDGPLVSTFGDVDRRINGNGLRRRWRQNKIGRKAASYRWGSALGTSARRGRAAVWKCQFAQRALIQL